MYRLTVYVFKVSNPVNSLESGCALVQNHVQIRRVHWKIGIYNVESECKLL